MLYNTKEQTIVLGNDRFNVISFGCGEKVMVMIAGLNARDAKGKAAAMGLAISYKDFTSDYTVYLFDRRETLPENFRIEDIAEDTARCMKYLGLRNAYVYGVSQGGMIAQCLAINHPELVKKLVLGVTASRINDTTRRKIESWCAMADAENLKGVLEDYFYETYSEAYLKKFRRLIPMALKTARFMKPARFSILAKSILSFDVYDRLNEITCPVLVLGGKEDKIVTPEGSLEIAEKLGCECFLYEGLGHSAYEEAPDFNDRVLRFFAD